MKIFISIVLSIFFGLASCSKPDNKYQGYVSATNIYLSSQFSGNLRELAVHRGDKVHKGDLLFKLDPDPQIYTLDELRSQILQNRSHLIDLTKPKRAPVLDSIKAKIAQAEAQISLATIRVKRNQTLFDRHVLAKDSLDLATEHLNELLAKKAQFVADLELAKLGSRIDVINAQKSKIGALLSKLKDINWILSEKTKYAPQDGYIYDTYFIESEFVPVAKPVLSLLTKENTYIEFFVPIKEMRNLQVGEKIKYRYFGDDKHTYFAKITYISPEAEYMPPLVYSRDNMDKIVFKIKSVAENEERLIPGLPVTVFVDQNHGK